MPLAAQTVVSTLVARLSGATAAGVRVYADHPQPFALAELPAWRIDIAEEPAEAVMLTGTIHEHRARVMVRGYVRALDDIDAALNALLAAATPALFAAPVPYALEIDGAIERDMVSEGQADLARVTLPLRALYFVAASAPETIVSN